MVFDNANPTILDTSELASHRQRRKNKNINETAETVMDILMNKDFYLIAPISDPEHPLSLESLGVVKLQDVHLSQIFDHLSPIVLSHVLVELTPTVTHCSLATVIGLGVRVRLEQALPPSYRVEVRIKKNTHSQAEEVSKQLGDKERVAAALENENLLGILKKMMRPCLEKSEN